MAEVTEVERHVTLAARHATKTPDVISERNIRVSFTEVQIVYLVIGLFGVLGNGLAAFVFCYSKHLRKNITNQFLIHQSLIDFLAATFLLASLSISSRHSLDGASGYTICVFWDSSLLVWTMFLISTFNLVALSLEKWLKNFVIFGLCGSGLGNTRCAKMITKALYHKAYVTPTLAYFIMGMCWVAGIAFQWTMFLSTSKVVDGKCYTMAFWKSAGLRKLLGVVTFILKLLAPVVIICYCYISMWMSLRSGSVVQVGNIHIQERKLKAQRNIIKTLVIVVVGFILCVSWNQVIFLLKNLEFIELDYTSTNYHLSVISYFINCCINPFIYASKYEKFRSVLRSMVCRNRVAPQHGKFGTTATTDYSNTRISHITTTSHGSERHVTQMTNVTNGKLDVPTCSKM